MYLDIRPALKSFIESTWHTNPMHKFCYENDTASLQALLSSSDSIPDMLSLSNDRGWTVLHVATFLNRVEVIKILASFSAGFLKTINIPGFYLNEYEVLDCDILIIIFL
jgi:ankyrin repeat protein